MMNSSTLRLLCGNPEANNPVEAGVDWKLDAACRGHLELFFARKAERP